MTSQESNSFNLESWAEQNFYTALNISHATDYPFVNPLNAVISILRRCNSRCVYCNSWKLPDDSPSDTTEWIRVIRELADLGVRELVFSGGEPLMARGLEEMIRVASEREMYSHIITNGILLSQKRLASLAEAGLYWISLSLDSLGDAEYRSTRGIPVKSALRALDVLSDFKQCWPERGVGINVVITAKNLSACPAILEMAAKRGFYVAFQAYTWHPDCPEEDLLPTADNLVHFEETIRFLVEAKKNGAPIATSVAYLEGVMPFLTSRSVPGDFKCMAAYLGVNIDTELNVVPCWHLPPVGNLRDSTLAYIWHSEPFRQIRGKMRNLECPKCWILCHTDLEGMCRRQKKKNDPFRIKNKIEAAKK